MSIYSNISQAFQVIDFSPTHSQLLLRSLKTKNRDYNIDIIMKGVSALLIPSVIKGMEISMLKDNQTIDFLKSRFNFKDEYDNRIFLIKDNAGKDFFINALCFGVYHNQLDILESSIGRYDFENFGELQNWYAA